MNVLSMGLHLFYSGLGNVASYLAAHVLLCLLPAFYIAGAMTALIPKETITRFLGRERPKYISYPAAALAGSVLAVCSCTIVPLFAGIYKKGAGLGPAITFLFFAPAANILALIYTGGIIGVDLALARLFLSLAFGIGIGLIMALIFQRDDKVHDEATDVLFSASGRMQQSALTFLLVLVMLLLSGTLKIAILTDTYFSFTLPLSDIDTLQTYLYRLIPFDPARGGEGVSAQGVLLIILLLLIGITSWKGIESIFDGFNRWTWLSLILLSATLLVAAIGMRPHSEGVDILITGKCLGILISLFVLGWIIKTKFTEDQIRDLLWESWKFVKQIFPLLVVGVFLVGVIRELIKPEWIEALAGQNTFTGNLAGVTFGVFMYFPTLVEVPIAQMFLNLGMHRGPLLAYLMADPELSLQSILITAAIIGYIKTWTYVAWVALFSTLAGFLYGIWIDGVSLMVVTLYLCIFISILSGTLWLVNKRARNNM
ncbi:permease [uncultured Tolumonas sp.]|uniref:permease n=1 Tax=uncultured Tolumonas sp. TaxID=263765 RepID=UPI00292ED55B|nr:permease [uncultured Tolumonas sp.]